MLILCAVANSAHSTIVWQKQIEACAETWEAVANRSARILASEHLDLIDDYDCLAWQVLALTLIVAWHH